MLSGTMRKGTSVLALLWSSPKNSSVPGGSGDVPVPDSAAEDWSEGRARAAQSSWSLADGSGGAGEGAAVVADADGVSVGLSVAGRAVRRRRSGAGT